MNIIKVENLAKKYVIDHQRNERYTALRDVIVNSIKSIAGGAMNRLAKFGRFPIVENTNSNKEDFWALQNVSFEVEQ